MFRPINTPEEFVKIAKREMIVRAWITLGRRRLMIQTPKNLYADDVIAYSISQEGKATIVLKCGVVIRVDYYVQGSTMFIENLENIDQVIVM